MSVAVTIVVSLAVVGATSPWSWGARRGFREVAAGRSRSAPPPTPVDAVLLLDLVDVALTTGASVPRALVAVGGAVGGPQGDHLARAGSSLLLGASWRSAWAGAGLADLADVLESSWSGGTAPGPALRARADQLRRERRVEARTAAGRLGVYLVLPLGLCFLPAFVLLGLVPMLLSLARGL